MDVDGAVAAFRHAPRARGIRVHGILAAAIGQGESQDGHRMDRGSVASKGWLMTLWSVLKHRDMSGISHASRGGACRTLAEWCYCGDLDCGHEEAV